MQHTLLIYFSMAFLAFSSCGPSESSACQYADMDILAKRERIALLKDKMASWDDNLHGRMDFIKRHYDSFASPLSELHNAIMDRNQSRMAKAKTLLDDTFQELKLWIQLNHWQNDDFYWLIQQSRREFKTLSMHSNDRCPGLSLFSFLDIEERFLSTLYMIAHTDEHVFSKLEPYVILEKDHIKPGDSIRINNYILAYDSTRVYEMTYWVNDSTFNPETGIYTNDFDNYVTGPKGVNRVFGIAKTRQYGRVFEWKWQGTFTVK